MLFHRPGQARQTLRQHVCACVWRPSVNRLHVATLACCFPAAVYVLLLHQQRNFDSRTTNESQSYLQAKGGRLSSTDAGYQITTFTLFGASDGIELAERGDIKPNIIGPPTDDGGPVGSCNMVDDTH